MEDINVLDEGDIKKEPPTEGINKKIQGKKKCSESGKKVSTIAKSHKKKMF
jgi:hypothetical protein